MRGAILAAVLLMMAWLILSPASGAEGLATAAAPSSSALLEHPASSSSEFLLSPGDGEWLRFSPAFITIRFLNASLGLIPEASSLQLDGVELPFSWSLSTQTIETVIDADLADGIHAVAALIAHGDGSTSELSWSFGLDTHAPNLEVEPVPSTTESSTLEVRGRATDDWLATVTVLGREVSLDSGNFSSPVVLWPGLNDIVVEARDRAGNLGRKIPTVRLQTASFDGATDPHVVAGAAFAIDVPQDWSAQEYVRLPSGHRADLVAVAPLQEGLQTEVVIVSETTTLTYPASRALEWMRLVLAGVEVSGQLKQVVSTPRLLEDTPQIVAVHSTFLRQTASERIAFMQVTMVWSRLLSRQWVVLASTDETRAVEMWPAVSATVASFRVLDEGLEGTQNVESGFFVPTILVIGAIVALLTIAGVALLPMYLAWRKTKREGRWRPPRNWHL